MKAKFIRIGLGVLVLAIWGAVIGRAIRTKPPESLVDIEQPKPVPTEPVSEVGPIVFVLSRDPFLGSPTVTPRTRTNAELPTKGRPTRPIKVAPQPASTPAVKHTVEYLGFIKNASSTGTAYVMLGIDGRSQLIMVGKEVMGVSVTEAGPHTATIAQNGTEEVLRIVR